MKSARYLLLFILALAAPASAQNDFQRFSNFDVFGGFSYGNFTVNNYRKDFDGFAVSVAADFGDHIGYELDYARQYGNDTAVAASPVSATSRPQAVFPPLKESQLLFGFRYPGHWRGARVFAHTLAGASKTPNHTKFTVCVGGGLDVQLTSHLALRAIQVDYIPQLQRLDYQASSWGNNVRLQTGLVLTIGPH